MPKRIKTGTGMMQREVLRYDVTRDAGPEERKAYTEALHSCMAQPVGDELREANAQRCREILATVGLGDMMDGTCAIDTAKLLEKGLSEDSAQWIAASWLRAFNRLKNERTRLEAGQGDVSLVVRYAEELGRIHERMFWRLGVDPQTGKKREELALGKREQEKAIPRATEARRIHAQDTKPAWHDDAKLEAMEIRRKHPSYSRWRIAGEIHEKFEVSRDRCDKVLRANGVE